MVNRLAHVEHLRQCPLYSHSVCVSWCRHRACNLDTNMPIHTAQRKEGSIWGGNRKTLFVLFFPLVCIFRFLWKKRWLFKHVFLGCPPKTSRRKGCWVGVRNLVFSFSWWLIAQLCLLRHCFPLQRVLRTMRCPHLSNSMLPRLRQHWAKHITYFNYRITLCICDWAGSTRTHIHTQYHARVVVGEQLCEFVFSLHLHI